MSSQWLECLVCQERFALSAMFFGCPACAKQGRKAPVVVRYDLRQANLPVGDASAPGIWRWRKLLPRVRETSIVSLHEGNTPLVEFKAWPGPACLYLKNETANPTWSYKDRTAAISASVASELGFTSIGTISTGNQGVSVAAYAAAAGLEAAVFCDGAAPALQLELMSVFGARVFRAGPRERMLGCLVGRGNWFPASVLCPRAGYGNPFGVEGFKTIAFELYQQLGGRVPDRVFVPVGSGDGFYGIWKGFSELRETGVSNRVPLMVACQAEGADPYVRAVRQGAHKLTALATVHTVALSIAETIGGEQTLKAIYDSGGTALGVPDEEIIQAAREVARRGLAIEPASAAAVACAKRMAAEASPGETWVAVATGAAVKWPTYLRGDFRMPKKLPPDFKGLDWIIPR